MATLSQVALLRANYDNSGLTAAIVKYWANETLFQIYSNSVMARQVNRDYDGMVARQGDTVNARRPAKMAAKIKVRGENIATTDANLETVPVVLSSHAYTSFEIDDIDQTLGPNFVRDFLTPAAMSIVEHVDSALCGLYVDFLDNSVGKLFGLTSASAVDLVVDARSKLTENLVPLDSRRMIVNPVAEGELLKNSAFTSAERLADDGETITTGFLSRKFGFDISVDQNMPYLRANGTADKLAFGAINNSGGYGVGTTSIVVNGITGTPSTNGEYITIAGDDTPQVIVGTTVSGGNITGLTIAPGLQHAVANGAAITRYNRALVNNAGGYPAGWVKSIAMDGFTSGKFLTKGQIVSFGTGANRHSYTVLSVDSASGTQQSVTLNKPLAAAIADNDPVFPGPQGGYNLAAHRNAITLVSRPLAEVPAGMGVVTSVVQLDGLGIRMTAGYDQVAQKYRVTVDLLYGVKTLDPRLGVVVFA